MTNSCSFGGDVKFHDPSCWVWWPALPIESQTNTAECINGNSGLVHKTDDEEEEGLVSNVSTASLVSLFNSLTSGASSPGCHQSLADLQSLKRKVANEYECAKDELHSTHRIFRQWIRR